MTDSADRTATTRRGVDPQAIGFLVAGMACFGSATPVSAIVAREFPAWLASGLRLLVAAGAVFIAMRVTPGRRSRDLVEEIRGLPRRDWPLLVGIAVVGTFGFSILMLLGMRHAPGAVAAVIMGTTPAVTAVGAALFLADPLDRWRMGAAILAAAGIVVVNVGGMAGHACVDGAVLGSVLVFGAVICEASYTLMGKRLSGHVSSVALVTCAAALAFVLFLPLAVWDLARFDWSETSAGGWLAVVWWGAGTMALGSWLWFRGLARVEAAAATPFMGVMPVSALLLSYVLLGESFAWIQLVGLALVLGGLAVIVRREVSSG